MDLVILAAGMGSRFGGSKQIEPIDDDGNFILDYSIYDAAKAGFDRVVLIIRKEHEPLFEKNVSARIKKLLPVKYAFQNMQDVPKGTKIPQDRIKPWGTAHALYSCRDLVGERFAVINSDDFYGFDSFQIVSKFLRNAPQGQFVSVGYKIKNTIPNQGLVKRGIFKLDGDKAVALVESKVERRGEKIFATPLREENWQEVSPETMVSMTMFGFNKKIFEQIETSGKTFFAQPTEILKTDEFLLPDIVNDCKGIELRVLPTKSTWHGVTYREDLQAFKDEIDKLKRQGDYPAHLYPEH